MLLGVKVTVVLFAVVLSLELTVPETALLELSVRVNVLAVRVVLSMTSLNVALKLKLLASVVAPFDGEVEETVGAVLSSLKAYDSKAGMVAEMPRLL